MPETRPLQQQVSPREKNVVDSNKSLQETGEAICGKVGRVHKIDSFFGGRPSEQTRF